MLSSTTANIAIASCASLVGMVQAQVQGFDISHYQATVDFGAAYSSGARFVIIKVISQVHSGKTSDQVQQLTLNLYQATEGTTFVDPAFEDHYTAATDAGFIRGGYHFAHPESSSGDVQAQFFIAHGGGWSADCTTLPGMLDLESTSSGECSNLSASAIVTWIGDFSGSYHASTGRYPMLYTSPSWWVDCTGNSTAFAATSPLVLAHWSSSVGPIPGGWPSQTIWQNADTYTYGGDADVFNGDLAALTQLATG